MCVSPPDGEALHHWRGVGVTICECTRQNGRSESATGSPCERLSSVSANRGARNLLTLSQILRLTDSNSGVPGRPSLPVAVFVVPALHAAILACIGEPLALCLGPPSRFLSHAERYERAGVALIHGRDSAIEWT